MPGPRDQSDAVAALLSCAVGAGLASRWVGFAARRDGGLCWAESAAGKPARDADLCFDLASLTKPLATTTLLLLARRDGLDLERELGDLLPELAGSAWAEVTAVQCATHTAGFPAWAPLYAGDARDRAAYLAALRRVAPARSPGSAVEYSCLGFVALGIALERAAGAALDELFAELVAQPLGVADELRFALPAGVPVAEGEARWWVEEALLGERGGGAPPPAVAGVTPCDDGNARGLGGVAGNAGLFGTAAAVARLAAEYLPGGGELLDGGEAELATRLRTEGLGQARGLGWQLASTPGCSAGPALSASAFGHTGFTGVSVWAEPKTGAVLVLLGNRLHPGGRTPDLHPLRRRFHTLALAALGGLTR